MRLKTKPTISCSEKGIYQRIINKNMKSLAKFLPILALSIFAVACAKEEGVEAKKVELQELKAQLNEINTNIKSLETEIATLDPEFAKQNRKSFLLFK